MSDLNRPGAEDGVRGDPPFDTGEDAEERDERSPQEQEGRPLPLSQIPIPPD